MKNLWYVLGAIVVCACSDGARGGATTNERAVHVTGAIQKGPFAVGSSILASNLDGQGNPTGDVFTTTTRDDLGQFDLDCSATDLIEVQGTGFYYNEATSSLSAATVTLRALYGVQEGVNQDVYVNLVTHLTAGRIRKLLADQLSFAEARAQAERELQLALGIVPATFAAGVDAAHMDLLGGDSDGNAYLFAVSAVLAQTAQRLSPAAADSALQELLNQLALDLEQTGTIAEARRTSIAGGLATLDTEAIERGLAARLTTLGSTASVPDLDRILDQDADGVPNPADNCPRLANGTQEDTDADGRGDACVPASLDLLFVIDNSIGMTDKHEVLAAAVPELVSRLVNPICVDATGARQDPPAAPGEGCAPGFAREFNPVNDINIGVVSSSLGDVGANVACPGEGFDRYVPDRIDMAHLLGSLTRGSGTANTSEGFLAWRAGTTELDAFSGDFQDMVRQVGEDGCGWEASLESWYRFLVDPYPYQQLVRVQCPGSSSTALNCVAPETDAENRLVLDETLLAQRAAFLRPDSRVAIVVVSDENDCSLQVGNQTWVVAAIDDARPMFRGSSTCESDPNAKCCYSCPLGSPDGCQADPICNADAANGVLQNRLPTSEDGQNLRCYQQKRRFGVDFLYPTRRYVNALTQPDICWNAFDLSTEGCTLGDLVQNPLYAAGRSPNHVFFGGIVGVPWQLISADVDADGRPLAAGQLRFQSGAELDQLGTWDEILGNPGRPWRPASALRPEVDGIAAVPPASPYMIESELPRAGITPGNAINGREFSTANSGGTPDDLEYSCIAPLNTPTDCTTRDPYTEVCYCYQGDTDRPICEQTPGTSAAGTTQYWTKAYPPPRHLEVLKDLGSNGILASICARNVTDPAAVDYGYRPAVEAIIEGLKGQLP
ncbi:MAG TPA: thrombospondin type 3 repeat-containing protein [Polyangiaceae bacterium]|nr:thrombospondin type 3 repeat-containing protein [Polyangiaceae bacterium]